MPSPRPSAVDRHVPRPRGAAPARAAWVVVSLVAAAALRAAAIEADLRPAHLVGEEDTALLARVQEVIDDWDPRTLRDPYVAHVPGVGPDGEPLERAVLRRRDLAEFIADADAAVALGKALFWDMQAGSDFRRVGGTFVGTACASCHYRFGADARDTHTTRIPGVVWNRHPLDERHPLAFGERQRDYDVAAEAARVIRSVNDLYLPHTLREGGLPARPGTEGDFENDPDDGPRTPLSLIVGSQGVPRLRFAGLNGKPPADPEGDWRSELSRPLPLTDPAAGAAGVPEDWEMFSAVVDGVRRDYRQVTLRNSPSVVNAGFADRLFHDGRAESTFNGFSIFGDDDRREVIHVRREGADGQPATVVPVRIAITHAALASQAVGPIVNEVEMSYAGRTFPDLARKLLDAPVLGHQRVGTDEAPDSALGRATKLGILRPGTTYRELIKRAFRREWWDGSAPGGGDASCVNPEDATRVELVLAGPGGGRQGSLMEANFPLYWGLAIMLYESGLVSNQSPFDAMMQGNSDPVNARWEAEHAGREAVIIDRAQTRHPPPAGTVPFVFTSGAEVFQRGFRVFLAKGCHDCHSGPLFAEASSRHLNGEIGVPIARAADQALLPNSRGDAIGLALRQEHRRVLERVAALLVESGASRPDGARSFALDLDLLRDRAGGYPRRLEELVRARLGELRLPATAATEIAEVLMGFERRKASYAGDRIFFSEDERLAFAERLVEPLLVERTPLPPDSAAVRPRLPFAGPPASAPYAFYDLGFYALGVAPPRYDRGIGDVSGDAEPAEHGAPEARVATTRGGRPPRRPAGATPAAALGSAYRFDPAWRRGGEAPARAVAPPALANPLRPGHPSADTSWVRDVPAWPGDFPPGALPELASRRRSDVHFFSRARRLVLSETTWGHRKPVLHDNELLFWGAFRTPSLRNVELTAPYMHNGRLPTLVDVLDFYDRGGDIPADRAENPDKHPAVRGLDLDEHDKLAVAFFLSCLTDERVRHEQAPFDHPSLRVVNGHAADGAEKIVEIPATGATGGAAPPTFPASR